MRPAAIATGVFVVVVASAAAAQTSRPTANQPPRPPRFTVSGGLLLNGGYDLGNRNAALRGNTAGSAAAFTLFRADSEMDGALGFEARLAYAFTRLVSIEVAGTRSTPDVKVTIDQDPESSGTTLVTDSVSQYTVDVAGVVLLPWQAARGRVRPYLRGGGGYLRQLHEDRLLVETGHTIFGGGGVQYAFGTSRRPLGIRAEASVVRRVGGIDYEDKSRTHPAISVLGFFAF